MKTLITDNLTGITTEVEIEEMPIVEIQQPEHQPTIEQRVAKIEQVTEEVITILNDKGIAQ